MKLKTQKAAAKQFGVQPSSFREWMKEPGFPDCSTGYDIDAIKRWRDANQRKGAELTEGLKKLSAAIKGEELKQARIDTETKSLKLDRLRGDLYPKVAAHLAISTALTTVSDLLEQWLDTIPVRSGVPEEYVEPLKDRLQAEFDSGRQRIEDEIKAALAHLAETSRHT